MGVNLIEVNFKDSTICVLGRDQSLFFCEGPRINFEGILIEYSRI